MKKVLLGIVVGLALGALAAWYFLRPAGGSATKPETPAETKEASFVHHGTKGETFLKLDRNVQTRMGLQTAPLAAASLKPEIKAYGRVLDPAPLGALIIELAGAQTALQASTREFERLKTLNSQNQNASARALETAEAAMRKDQILLDSIGPRLLLGWGKAVASQPDLPAFFQALAVQEAALVRVDLPLGTSLAAPPTQGRVAAIASPDALHEAQYLGPVPSADPQMQAQGFLFLQKSNPLPPGAAVVAWLTVPGETVSGVVVPRDGLLRHEGGVFVYLQTGDETFVRKGVVLERPLDTGWFVREGLQAQDKIVIVGAQELLSEEFKGQGGEE